jgi:predicted O-methyltransferase YrrM
MEYLSEDARHVVELAGAAPEPLLGEMEAHGRERGFPTVGPAVGRLLRLLARTVGARRIFEFGSGFGYSAAWFAGALPDDGELVLTDYEESNLEAAREFLARGDYDASIRFEAGDAMETARSQDGPWDVVLIDHDKARYAAALELVREELASPALVVADNVLAGPVDPDEVRAALEGDAVGETVAGIAEYLETVRDDPALETSVVPLGEGLAVSYVA